MRRAAARPVTRRRARLTLLSVLVVWAALILPDRLGGLTPGALARLPVEALLLVALGLVLPTAARRALAAVAGVALGLRAVLMVIDWAFFSVLGQPFDPRTDWRYPWSAVGVLKASAGPYAAVGAVAAALVVLLAVLALVTWSTVRLTRVATEHRTASGWLVSTVTLAWLLCACLGLQVAGAPVAATTARLPWAGGRAPVHDAAPEAADPFALTAPEDLLTGLRGKDVLLVFVESYGRVAVEDPSISPGVQQVLTRGDRSLEQSGFSSRSAFLTSPTFAGISWLAHATLQSGRWVDTQQRYDRLLQTDRLTLSSAFRRAGWRTVDAVPSNDDDWPQGRRFYRFDEVYDRRNTGYAGPSFSYAAMPDQYTLAALERSELSALQRAELSRPQHPPVMAEVDLVSSHGPWAPLPRMVPWGAVGDGSVYAGMPAQGPSAAEVIRDRAATRQAYGASVQYSLTAVISFVQHLGDDNLVLVVVGDHQPATVVSGTAPSHDVPISVIAHDPAVLDRMAGWGWQPGLLPHPDAPVWPMDTFRDRFLTAYGAQPGTPAGRHR
jgi:hypothetical protein